MKVYECEICHGLNHKSHFGCQFCGTIPAMYSVIRKPTCRSDYMRFALVAVVAAFGCERQNRSKHSRCYFRTVPADYYASV